MAICRAIRDVEVTLRIQRYAGGPVESRIGGGAAITQEALHAISGDRSDDARCDGQFANTVVAFVRKIEVPGGIERNAARIESREDSWAAVA